MKLLKDVFPDIFGDFDVWSDHKIFYLSNEKEVLYIFQRDKWVEYYSYLSKGFKNNLRDLFTIISWTDSNLLIFFISEKVVVVFDTKTQNRLKEFPFPSGFYPHTFLDPTLLIGKNVNIEGYEWSGKEISHYDLEKQEILSSRIYLPFSILTTNQKFLFCLSQDFKKLECFDIFQGQQEVWHFDFEAEGYEVLKNEPPAQYADMLLFTVRGKEGQSTLAIDSQTGKKRWYCEIGYLPDVSCTYKGNLVSYRGIWYNDVVHINPQTGEITEHWHLPDWLNNYPVDLRGRFTIDEQNLYLAPKNYVGLDHEFYEGKGVLVFSLETHELVQELPCKINMECKKIEKVGKRLFVHDHGNLHIFVEE